MCACVSCPWVRGRTPAAGRRSLPRLQATSPGPPRQHRVPQPSPACPGCLSRCMTNGRGTGQRLHHPCTELKGTEGWRPSRAHSAACPALDCLGPRGPQLPSAGALRKEQACRKAREQTGAGAGQNTRGFHECKSNISPLFEKGESEMKYARLFKKRNEFH